MRPARTLRLLMMAGALSGSCSCAMAGDAMAQAGTVSPTSAVNTSRSPVVAPALATPAGPRPAASASVGSGSPEALAARESRLAHALRCVVCQNQSLAESNAPLAADMRAVILEQLTAGRSDSEVVAFFEQRYGAFVSYRPPWRPSTWLLWLGPFLIALAGLAVLARALGRQQAVASPMPPVDDALLQRFLEGGPGPTSATPPALPIQRPPAASANREHMTP